MREFISIVEGALPDTVYHGTILRKWESPAGGTGGGILFLTNSRDEAESYADQAYEQGCTTELNDDGEFPYDAGAAPVIVSFDFAQLLKTPGLEFDHDWGWNDAPNGATWQQSLNAVGSFVVIGFTEAHKSLAKVELAYPEYHKEKTERLVENDAPKHIPSPQELTAAINECAQRYIATGVATDLYQINNGSCEDLAEEVVQSFVGHDQHDEFFVIGADNLSIEGEGDQWDVPLINRYWPACKPTHGLTWDDVLNEVPSHVWIVLNGRHYDCECPEGVENMFDIPLLRRGMERLSGSARLDESFGLDDLSPKIFVNPSLGKLQGIMETALRNRKKLEIAMKEHGSKLGLYDCRDADDMVVRGTITPDGRVLIADAFLATHNDLYDYDDNLSPLVDFYINHKNIILVGRYEEGPKGREAIKAQAAKWGMVVSSKIY